MLKFINSHSVSKKLSHHLSQDFCCCDKHHDKSNLVRGGFIWFIFPHRSSSSSEGGARARARAVIHGSATEAVLEQKPWRVWLPGLVLAFLDTLVCHLLVLKACLWDRLSGNGLSALTGCLHDGYKDICLIINDKFTFCGFLFVYFI